MNVPSWWELSESGYCACGCGEKTSLAPQTRRSRGWIKDEPMRFVLGHGNRKHPHGWDVNDCGYVTPCWLWRGAKTPLGYAKRGPVNVFREMWEERNGSVPEGLELDHLCRVPECVNPEHLEPVTHAENIRRSRTARINHRIADEIRTAPGTLRALGEQYGIHHTTVLDIKRGRAWT